MPSKAPWSSVDVDAARAPMTVPTMYTSHAHLAVAAITVGGASAELVRHIAPGPLGFPTDANRGWPRAEAAAGRFLGRVPPGRCMRGHGPYDQSRLPS